MQTIRVEWIALQCCDCLPRVQVLLPLLNGLLDATRALPFVSDRLGHCVLSRELQLRPV